MKLKLKFKCEIEDWSVKLKMGVVSVKLKFQFKFGSWSLKLKLDFVVEVFKCIPKSKVEAEV